MVKKLFLVSVLSMFLLISFISAEVSVEYFHSMDCPHCANVASSGILNTIQNIDGVNYTDYLVNYDVKARERFLEINNILGLDLQKTGVPFIFINYSGNLTYLVGDKPIIDNAENHIRTGNFIPEKQENIEKDSPKDTHSTEKNLTIWSIAASALVDSVNPCAFGVLIFLMISLLKAGSSKRALRYGLIYSFVVFLVYFLTGFGLFKVIQTLSSVGNTIYLIAGLLVLGLGILEFVDYFRSKYNKESILKIPKKAKPILEKISTKGTLVAIMTLGILVSLFELPCTGGIYLAILTLMAKHGTFAWGYLALYNLIFVLPLVVITLIIYKGISPEKLQSWTQNEKGWMKISAGIVLVLLGFYLLLGKLL